MPGLLVAGPSGAGKSTLLATLRERVTDEPRIAFPLRFTTRPRRDDDVPWENRSVSDEEFDGLWRAGRLSVRWSKPLGDRSENYGFETRPESVLVLGGNDSLFLHQDSVVESTPILASMDIVYVWCPPETRLERLKGRDATIEERSAELTARLQLDARESLPSGAQIIDTRNGIAPGAIDSVVARLLGLANRE
jgi:ribose 1,5-bisphosphokinase PhnN